MTGYKQVDLAGLYRQVALHGGYDMVSDRKWWRNIGAPGLPGFTPHQMQDHSCIGKHQHHKSMHFQACFQFYAGIEIPFVLSAPKLDPDGFRGNVFIR